MQQFVPLHVHSHYSILDSLSKPHQIAERCTELGYKACALTDHGGISGSIQFIKTLKDTCACGHQKGIHDNGKHCRKTDCKCEAFQKGNLKPILGSEFYISEKDPSVKDKSNRKLSHLVVLAKNLNGWHSLIRATSEANKPEYVYYKKPRLTLEQLANYSNGDFISFSGHMGSDLANVLFIEPKLAYKAKTYEEAKLLVRPDWKEAVLALTGKYVELFGKDNFYLEVQLIDHKSLPAAEIISKIIRWVSKKLNVPCVASCNAYYPRKEDSKDQRVLLCTQLNTNINAAERKIDNGEDVTFSVFFKSNNYHIPSLEEMVALHEPEELVNTVLIADKCESYNVLNKPIMPQFNCPDNLSTNEYLHRLCQNGWQKKIAPNIPKDKLRTYADRLEMELGVIKKADLASCFLIVQDYVNFARSNNWLVGPGRGSSAGCLISNLIGITSIDPIQYNLLFERFYNEGRNTADRIAYPDIDSDFPKRYRQDMINYISNKYGKDKVSQMITFGRMQGKAAFKDVVRARATPLSLSEVQDICNNIPGEAEISDKLQDMRERDGEASIIRWALENNSEALKTWCHISEEGKLEGEYADVFAQAIRLEGTKRNHGKHASGIVVASTPLAEICPMVYDGESDVVAGFEMNDVEAIGLIKLDVLGVAVLDKVMDVQQLLQDGTYIVSS